jgi:hypothetical protein
LSLWIVPWVCPMTLKMRRSVVRKVYAVDYPSGRSNGTERMGIGREPKHERKHEWAA